MGAEQLSAVLEAAGESQGGQVDLLLLFWILLLVMLCAQVVLSYQELLARFPGEVYEAHSNKGVKLSKEGTHQAPPDAEQGHSLEVRWTTTTSSVVMKN